MYKDYPLKIKKHMRRLSNKAIITTSFGRIFSSIFVVPGLRMLLANIQETTSEEILSSGLTLAITIALFLLVIVYSVLWVRWYYYEVAPDEFKKEYGVISKSYTSIPYSRIQNVNIERSLLERMLGISTLQIQTAGTGMIQAEGRVPGIEKDTAEEVREAILSKSRSGRQAGQGVPEPGV
ncbi:MAG: PH domain-containing protein [Candidatus Paceibacterota bacterium]